MATGIDGFSSEAREEIAREISTGSLSSYQIAHRHGITKAAVDSIGKANFGAEIYGRRESLAEMNLRGQVAELLSKGASGNEIARRLGLARSSCHRFISEARSGAARLPPSQGSGDVKVISLPEPGEALAPSGPSRLPAPEARPRAPLPARRSTGSSTPMPPSAPTCSPRTGRSTSRSSPWAGGARASPSTPTRLWRFCRRRTSRRRRFSRRRSTERRWPSQRVVRHVSRWLPETLNGHRAGGGRRFVCATAQVQRLNIPKLMKGSGLVVPLLN